MRHCRYIPLCNLHHAPAPRRRPCIPLRSSVGLSPRRMPPVCIALPSLRKSRSCDTDHATTHDARTHAATHARHGRRSDTRRDTHTPRQTQRRTQRHTHATADRQSQHAHIMPRLTRPTMMIGDHRGDMTPGAPGSGPLRVIGAEGQCRFCTRFVPGGVGSRVVPSSWGSRPRRPVVCRHIRHRVTTACSRGSRRRRRGGCDGTRVTPPRA